MRLRHFRDSVARYFRDRPRRAPVQLPAEIKMAPLCNVSDDNNQKSDETQTVVQNGEACNGTSYLKIADNSGAVDRQVS